MSFQQQQHTTLIQNNSEKSKEIIISFEQDGNLRSTIPNIKNDGRDIAQVCHAKLLDLTILSDKYVTYSLFHVAKRGNYNPIGDALFISVFLFVYGGVLRYILFCF